MIDAWQVANHCSRNFEADQFNKKMAKLDAIISTSTIFLLVPRTCSSN